jgi:hypothetical protein
MTLEKIWVCSTVLLNVCFAAGCAGGQKKSSCPLDFPTTLDHESTYETHREAVLALFEQVGIEKMWDDLLNAFIQKKISQKPMLVPLKPVMLDFLTTHMSFKDFKEDIIAIYMQYYTELEIRQISAIQGMEISRKVTGTAQAILLKMSEIVDSKFEEKSGILKEMIEGYLKEHPELLKKEEPSP